MFDLKLQYIANWVRDRGYASVALQLPEGLKLRATEIVDFLTQETEANYVMLGDPCYGACDLFINYASVADALVHFGHSPIPSQGDDPDVLYIEADMRRDLFNHMQDMSFSFFDRNRTGQLMSRATNDLFEITELSQIITELELRIKLVKAEK